VNYGMKKKLRESSFPLVNKLAISATVLLVMLSKKNIKRFLSFKNVHIICKLC